MGEVVSVETYTGDSAYGAIYAPAVTVPCNVRSLRRLVIGGDGEEATSEVTLEVRPDDVDHFMPESRVTFATRTSKVLSITPATYKGRIVFIQVACA